MNVTLRPKIMSIEDFLAWESRQERRWEYDGFEPVEMVGGSRRHARIQSNLNVAIGYRLRGSQFGFFGSDMKLLLPTTVRYPDGQIANLDTDEEATFITAPIALFEVLSPSTAGIDNGAKLQEYRRLPTLRDYVVIEQDRPAVTHHTRGRDGGWTTLALSGLEADLILKAVGLAIPLSEIYDRVAF